MPPSGQNVIMNYLAPKGSTLGAKPVLVAVIIAITRPAQLHVSGKFTFIW